MTELTFTITGMHCASCGLLIDDAIEDLPGVTTSTTNHRAGQTTVQLDKPNQAATAQIIKVITELGYQACEPG